MPTRMRASATTPPEPLQRLDEGVVRAGLEHDDESVQQPRSLVILREGENAPGSDAHDDSHEYGVGDGGARAQRVAVGVQAWSAQE